MSDESRDGAAPIDELAVRRMQRCAASAFGHQLDRDGFGTCRVCGLTVLRAAGVAHG